MRTSPDHRKVAKGCGRCCWTTSWIWSRGQSIESSWQAP